MRGCGCGTKAAPNLLFIITYIRLGNRLEWHEKKGKTAAGQKKNSRNKGEKCAQYTHICMPCKKTDMGHMQGQVK